MRIKIRVDHLFHYHRWIPMTAFESHTHVIRLIFSISCVSRHSGRQQTMSSLHGRGGWYPLHHNIKPIDHHRRTQLVTWGRILFQFGFIFTYARRSEGPRKSNSKVDVLFRLCCNCVPAVFQCLHGIFMGRIAIFQWMQEDRCMGSFNQAAALIANNNNNPNTLLANAPWSQFLHHSYISPEIWIAGADMRTVSDGRILLY